MRKIHAMLTGTDADGSRFRLDEPELLLWVHCGEDASYVDIARRSGMGLSGADLDAFVDEQRRGAAVVGLDPATVPGSVAELDAYYEEIRPSLHACAEAKQALRKSYHPDLPAQLLPLRLMLPPINTLAFATLPRWARRMYGAPGSPLTDVGATLALRMAHQSVTRIPRQLTYLPAARAAHRRERERQAALQAAQGRRRRPKRALMAQGGTPVNPAPRTRLREHQPAGGRFHEVITGWSCSVPSVLKGAGVKPEQAAAVRTGPQPAGREHAQGAAPRSARSMRGAACRSGEWDKVGASWHETG